MNTFKSTKQYKDSILIENEYFKKVLLQKTNEGKIIDEEDSDRIVVLHCK